MAGKEHLKLCCPAPAPAPAPTKPDFHISVTHWDSVLITMPTAFRQQNADEYDIPALTPWSGIAPDQGVSVHIAPKQG